MQSPDDPQPHWLQSLRYDDRAQERLAQLFLFCLPALFFWRETLGWKTLSDGDALFWFYPAYQFVAEQLRAGKLPLWNPFMYSGTPLFAQWQAGVFDPLNWLFLPFGVTSRMMTIVQELAYAVGLLGMFRYTRCLGLKRRACVMAAVIYALSGFAVARVIYPGFLHIFALTPWVLYVIEDLRQRPSWRMAALGAVLVAWQLFAAHPQPFAYGALLAGAYALFRLRIADCGLRTTDVQPTIHNRQAAFLFLRQSALVYLGGVALAAIQVLPAAETARQSVRQDWPFELFTLNSLHPASLLVTLFPFWHGQGRGIYAMGYWGAYWHHYEAQIYLGVVAMSLAGAGAYAAWRGRLHPWNVARFWSMVAVVGVLLSLGRYIEPLARLLHPIPIIGHFRSPNRHWMEVVFAVAVLAGFAVDLLLRADDVVQQKRLAQVAQLLAVSLTLLCATVGGFVLWNRTAAERLLLPLRDMNWVPPGFFQKGGPEFYVPMLTAVVLCAALLLFLRAPQRGRWFVMLFVAMLGDYHLYAYFGPINNDEPHLERRIGRAMPPSLAAQESVLEPFRYQQMLNPTTGEFNPFWLYGHELASGYDPILNTRYKTFSGIDEAGRSYLPTLLQPQDRTLDLLNVRYILVAPNFLTPPATAATVGLSDPAHWREVPNDSTVNWYKDMKVYENLRAQPRAWLVGQAQVVATEYDQLRLIRGELKAAQGKAFDPLQTALLEPGAAAQPWAQQLTRANGGTGTARIIERSHDRLLIETEAKAETLLVLSEMAYPGWHARVDGQEVEWQRVNYILCGVPVATGKHRVEFVYQPQMVKNGAVVTLTTALGLLCLIVWERWRRQRAAPPKAADVSV
ncbi:MAG: YfhO family protein [Acidobacteria bacterium]|nr:YfhO family protein [Acidobacteriota bacterium]MBI3422923.1 YfhO family protein [Acidobacteriota bacterium]